MFGEKEIIGHGIYKMDSKNRLPIPPFAHGEPGEELYAKTYKSKNGKYVLKLLSPEEYKEEIKRLEIIINNPAITYDELQRAKKDLEILYYKLAASFVVSKQKKITIPKYLMEKLEWETDEDYQIDGLGNSLMISKKK